MRCMSHWGCPWATEGFCKQDVPTGLWAVFLMESLKCEYDLMSSESWLLCSQPSSTPQLCRSLHHSGWMKKVVGFLGSISYTRETWALIHMLLLYHMGEIIGWGEVSLGIEPYWLQRGDVGKVTFSMCRLYFFL